MPKGHRLLPGFVGSSLWKSAATALVFLETVGGINYIIAVDGTTHAVIGFQVAATADDVLINACIVYVAAFGGGQIYFEEGTYTATATITMDDSIGLYGVGDACHITTSGEFHLITISAQNDCIVENIKLSHTLAAGNYEVISIDGVDRFIINRVKITDSPRFGIGGTGLLNIEEGWVTNCHITGTEWEGIYFGLAAGNTIVNLVVAENFIADTGQGAPISVLLGSRILITDNITEDTGGAAGIYLYRCSYSIVADNIIDDNRGSGIFLDRGDTTVVEGNMIYSSSGQGIRCDTITYSVIADNIINDPVTNGIDMNSSDYNSITGNHIYSAGSDGIDFNATSDYNHVHGNYFIGNGAFGVLITAGATENDVRDNFYSGNVSGAISDGGTDTRVHEVSVTAPNPDSYVGYHATQQMLDDVKTVIRCEVPAPNNLYELVTAQVVVIPSGTGNLSCIDITEYGRICHDELYNAHDGSVDYTVGDVIPVTINEMECIDVAATIPDLTAHDWIGNLFLRVGDDIADTVNAKIDFLGYRLRYV